MCSSHSTIWNICHFFSFYSSTQFVSQETLCQEVKSAYQKKIFFLFLNQNICCGCSKEPSQWDDSFEHPKHLLEIIYNFTLKNCVVVSLTHLSRMDSGRTGWYTKQMCSDMRFPIMWYVRPAKSQISLRIRAVWSEHLLVAWIFYEC